MQRNSLLLIVILETEFLKWSNYEDSHIGSQKFKQSRAPNGDWKSPGYKTWIDQAINRNRWKKSLKKFQQTSHSFLFSFCVQEILLYTRIGKTSST